MSTGSYGACCGLYKGYGLLGESVTSSLDSSRFIILRILLCSILYDGPLFSETDEQECQQKDGKRGRNYSSTTERSQI